MIVRQHIFEMTEQTTKIKTLAGIVLLNPEIGRLRENIDAIKPQVDLCRNAQFYGEPAA